LIFIVDLPSKDFVLTKDSEKPALPFYEFVALMAFMTSLIAFSIDAMLPALSEVGRDLNVVDSNDSQLIVPFLFLGLAFGQMIYGPMSDSTGRKPAVYLGFLVFIIGCVLCVFSTDLTIMLVGRFLQGVGLAGPRIVSIALVRDQFEGREMARVMSFIMVVFIIVPTIAPVIGQGILLVASWRAIFVSILMMGIITLIWFTKRQPETLLPSSRQPFSLQRNIAALKEVLSIPTSSCYGIAAGLITGAFLGYLSSAQQIFQLQYELGVMFPLVFAILSLAIGFASFLNGKLVMRYGMELMSKTALQVIALVSFVFGLVVSGYDGHPPLWMLMLYCSITLFGIGILFGNLNALAMEPLGHIAGVGAAVVGSLTTFISVPIGVLIGQSYNNTVLPLVLGFAVFASLSFAIMLWVERKV